MEAVIQENGKEKKAGVFAVEDAHNFPGRCASPTFHQLIVNHLAF
jgi:hypothetical protein